MCTGELEYNYFTGLCHTSTWYNCTGTVIDNTGSHWRVLQYKVLYLVLVQEDFTELQYGTTTTYSSRRSTLANALYVLNSTATTTTK